MVTKLVSVNYNKHTMVCLAVCKPMPHNVTMAIYTSQQNPVCQTLSLLCYGSCQDQDFDELKKYIYTCIYYVCMDPWKCRLAPFGFSLHP